MNNNQEISKTLDQILKCKNDKERKKLNAHFKDLMDKSLKRIQVDNRKFEEDLKRTRQFRQSIDMKLEELFGDIF